MNKKDEKYFSILLKVREKMNSDCKDNTMGFSDRYFRELIFFIIEESDYYW